MIILQMTKLRLGEEQGQGRAGFRPSCVTQRLLHPQRQFV